ncbi:MAG: symporter small accessory protein [Halanaerobiaceae bacterium]
MLGMQDTAIAAALFLSMASALLCVVYGVLKSNKGGDEN